MTVGNFLVEFRSRIGSFNIQEKGKPVQIGVLRQARNLHFYTSFFLTVSFSSNWKFNRQSSSYVMLLNLL